MKEFIRALTRFDFNALFREKTTNTFIQFFRYINYILSVCFVFSETEKVKSKAKEFIVYAVIGVIGLLLTEAIMYLCTDIIGMYFLLSKIVAAAIVLIWNFVARKKILYTNK